MLKSAEKIVKTLTKNGHTAYFAGGVVRDMLLDRETSDVDIATSATPEEIEKLFEKTHPLGREFGVMLVLIHKHAFEVATFRGERDYDGRKPGEVFFTDAREDAKRRDFTVNGMFYDPDKRKVLDFVDGEKDLKKQLIRFIGDAEERVQEDHLRILRGVRFRNLLNFEYEDKTKIAIQEHAHLLQQISGERIRDELNKIMEDENRGKAFRDLEEFGILEVVMPELMKLRGLKQPEKYHKEGDCFTHSLAALAALPKDVDVATAWATLLHDVGKTTTIATIEGRVTYPGHAEEGVKITEKILKRLRMNNATRAKIVWLIRNHMSFFDVTKQRLARKHEFFTHPWFPDLVHVTAADIRGTAPAEFSLHRKIVSEWKTHINEKLLPAPQVLLTGDEIMTELHVAKGPEVGRLLKILNDAQIEGLAGSREEAIKFLESCLRR
jgi:poly(A) polymerase